MLMALSCHLRAFSPLHWDCCPCSPETLPLSPITRPPQLRPMASAAGFDDESSAAPLPTAAARTALHRGLQHLLFSWHWAETPEVLSKGSTGWLGCKTWLIRTLCHASRQSTKVHLIVQRSLPCDGGTESVSLEGAPLLLPWAGGSRHRIQEYE